MVDWFLKSFICAFLFSVSSFFVFGSSSCFPRPTNPIFHQKTDRFWEFDEKSNSWVEVDLPFDLISCINGNCTKVGSISQPGKKEDLLDKRFDTPEEEENSETMDNDREIAEEGPDQILLPVRRRISLTKISETSIWVTGESGSIYERYWNGVQWVIAPHDLPTSLGPAVSVFIVNQTILALSESGNLYQMQLSESSQPIWIECTPTLKHNPHGMETSEPTSILIKSGVVSYDKGKVYFSTMDGSLLELTEVEPWRWIYHGKPPGANVAAIADAATIKPDVVFTISSSGDLYELDRNSKPSWKKHLWSKSFKQQLFLTPSKGCTIHGLIGTHSTSLFLLTKDGNLVERRLHQRKWGWIVHGSPIYHHLTSITTVAQDDDLNEKIFSLFFTTSVGSIFEFRLPRYSGGTQGDKMTEQWVNHMHPLNAKAARGIAGLQSKVGRILFPLDDGRLAELHLYGIGKEGPAPTQQVNMRRKASFKYEWSILEAPETEGWNAEYCTEERGPSNCITGIKDGPNESRVAMPTASRRKQVQFHQSYLVPGASSIGANSPDQNNFSVDGTNTNFRMRVMHTSMSFFVVTDYGVTFEHLNIEDVWFWLRHEHPTIMKGIVGNYNGSLFLVDIDGNLLIRERSGDEVEWLNCTAMRNGAQVMGGPPWDKILGKSLELGAEDALFFVSKTGRLLQFTVALRKFEWKDCQHPLNSRVASIVDQEMFRTNIVFVIGRNGRLYQYNKVTELWHEHYQSPHLVLSRLPGTSMRPSSSSLIGSLFMISEDGGLVEYQWNPMDGWSWVEHGTPSKSVFLVGSPGPCFEGNQFFLIGSDGEVYLRYLDETTWKWRSYGYPSADYENFEGHTLPGDKVTRIDNCVDEVIMAGFQKNVEDLYDLNKSCDTKVATTRPIPFSEYSVIFELRDGRLAELHRIDDTEWIWTRTIVTPMSQCMASYGLAS